MGCYDTVIVPCPACGERVEFQSKSGPCTLEVFELTDAPDDVLLNVNRHSPHTCPKCKTKFMVQVANRAPTVILPRIAMAVPVTELPKESLFDLEEKYTAHVGPSRLVCLTALTALVESEEANQALKELLRQVLYARCSLGTKFIDELGRWGLEDLKQHLVEAAERV